MSLEIGPRQSPDARTDIMFGWGYIDNNLISETFGIDPKEAPDMRRCLQDATSGSALYWIHSDITDLAHKAAPTLPPDTEILPELLPCRCGLIIFEAPIVLDDSYCVDAISWQPVVHDHSAVPHMEYPDGTYLEQWVGNNWVPTSNDVEPVFKELWVHAYTRLPNRSVPWCPLATFYFDFGISIHEQERDTGALVWFLFSLFALMRSPGVAETIEQPQERHARKRSQRAGTRTDAVRIIRLRRHETSGHHDGTSNYHHRWIVSGHWRSQPYGPGRLQRKPVWIMPHIKGPEGAPMLTGDKVRVL